MEGPTPGSHVCALVASPFCFPKKIITPSVYDARGWESNDVGSLMAISVTKLNHIQNPYRDQHNIAQDYVLWYYGLYDAVVDLWPKTTGTCPR